MRNGNIKNKGDVNTNYLTKGDYNTFNHTNTITNCDFSKKTSIKNYYIITNTAKAIMDSEVGHGKYYDRYILGSLWLNTDWKLNGLRGYIKYIDYKRYKNKNMCMLVVGNVFKEDLYISNHLCFKLDNEYIQENNLQQGAYISFNGEVERYYANGRDALDGYKFGITNFSEPNILSNSFIENMETIILTNFTREFKEVEPPQNYFYYFKWIISKITQKITTLKDNIVPVDFYTNAILSIHFSERIEKYMLLNQSNYDYLYDNAKYLCLPFSAVLYMMEELKIYDPYTIISVIVTVYNLSMFSNVEEIASMNDIPYRELYSTLFLYVKNINNKMRSYNIDDLITEINNYSIELLEKYNNEIY